MITTMTLGGVLAASFILVAAIRVRRDVHRRRRAERELQDFFRLSVDPMVVLGSNGCILRLNPAWTAILGHAAESLRGKSFLELVHPDDIEPTRDHMAKLGHASASVSFEARYRTSRDEWRWFQWNAIPAKSGAVIYGAARDITDYKAALAALKKSADEIRDLYNLAPCGYHSLGADGRFLAINDTELSWLGYTRAEVVGKLRFPELLTSSSHLSFDESFQRFKTLGSVNDLEFEVVRKDGTTFPVSLSATAIRDADGTFIASRSTLFDITERKHVEHRIRRLNMDLQLQNARLEIANKELESFSYSISHDLRAPLRHIDGFAGLLAQHASQTLDDKGRRFISVISESAKRMGRLIDDLLTFSRMGRTVMDEIEIDHDQLVAAVIRDGRFEATPAIQWHVSPLPRVRADAAMLRQVWVNLIDNAVKYSAQSTPPRIEIGAFTDSADPTEFVFFVKDNGVGFDMKYAAKLFGVFQRLHTDAEFEGTGIGLANVRRIVTRHGGRSWAESSVGAGSTFYFSLPAAIHPPLPTSL
jgi:PAS domain S-box-containing protein